MSMGLSATRCQPWKGNKRGQAGLAARGCLPASPLPRPESGRCNAPLPQAISTGCSHGGCRASSAEGPSLLQSPPHLGPGAVPDRQHGAEWAQCMAGFGSLHRLVWPCRSQALAGLWSRRTEAGLVQVTCRLSPSQMRGEKVSPPCAEAAPLPSALPSGWDSQVSTGCSHRAGEASSHGEYGTALSAAWWEGGIGLEKTKYPTYIYPKELKNLMRSAFPAGVCNYPDPGHSKVVHVTLEDLRLLDHPGAGSAQPFAIEPPPPAAEHLLEQEGMRQQQETHG
ncbi:unnamed protein product [Lepidochelys olivacea]